MKTKQEHHIIITEPVSAVELLAKNTNFSRQKLKLFMRQGCVWLEQGSGDKKYIQRLRRAKKVLKVGDGLHFYYDEKVLTTPPLKAMLVSDQGGYSIWNKPAGMLSQGSKWGDHCTIYRWAENELQPERPAFIVHRLDRAASGLIILAHKKKVAARFAALFQAHEIEKHYQVKVQGDFSIEFPESKVTKTISSSIDGKSATSHIHFIDYDKYEDKSLLDVHIETGRKHQIRKHLLSVGFPVIGDRLYGSKEEQELNKTDLQLKAVLLKFVCPVSTDCKVFTL